jgi:hypothetical protein
LVDDAIRVLKPDGSAFFVTEDLATAKFLAETAANRGVRPILYRTVAKEAAPAATGEGIPNFTKDSAVYVVYFIRTEGALVVPIPVP